MNLLKIFEYLNICMKSELGYVADNQLKQLLKKIVSNEQFDEYYNKMLDLEKSQDAILDYFDNLFHTFSIANDLSSSYYFIIKHILDKSLIKSPKNIEIQNESDIIANIQNDNDQKQLEKNKLDDEIKELTISYQKTKEERDKIIQEFKFNESLWSKLPHKIDKKEFRLYSDLLYVIEDLQRSINKV